MPIGLGTVYVRALVPCTHIIASVEIENRKKMSPLAQFIILDFLERIVFFSPFFMLFTSSLYARFLFIYFLFSQVSLHVHNFDRILSLHFLPSILISVDYEVSQKLFE